jgi:putative salt-induced outer membrane protein YdiY
MLMLLATLALAQPVDTVTFTGDLGFVNTSGNTKLTTINVGDKLEATAGGWGVVQTFGVIYGTNDGETSTSLWRGALRGDRGLTPRLGVFVLSEFERNTFAGIGSRYAESVGLAAKLIDGTRDKLDAEMGGGYVWQNATEGAEDRAFAMARGALMYARALGEKATFSQMIEFLPNLEVGEDLRINAETSLTAPIGAGISMKAGYLIRYDGLPEPGFVKTDRILTTGLQVTF